MHSLIILVESESQEPFPYVFVKDDGSVRELTTEERKYLCTPFYPSDGARPYIKKDYPQRDGGGSISGFIQKTSLPDSLKFNFLIGSLPVESEVFQKVFEYLVLVGCDHDSQTFANTIRYLSINNFQVQEVLNWMHDNATYCDNQVLTVLKQKLQHLKIC